jgi:aspartyl protease family protein
MRFLLLSLAILVGGAALLIMFHDTGVVFGVQTEDFAQIIQLTAIGLLVATAISWNGFGAFRKAFMALTIWGLALLGLVVGYAYKDDLGQVAQRVQAVLIPGTVIEQPGGSISVMRGIGGHFHLTAMVNDMADISFLVDTGASTVVLSHGDAARAGIDIENLIYSAPVLTANGRTTAASIRLDTISVGDITVRNINAMVSRPGVLETSLLGMTFLSRFSNFNIDRDQMTLMP